MKQYYAPFLVFFTSFYAFGQDFEWTGAVVGSDYKDSRSVSIDNAGNTYLTGWFSETIDLDPGPGLKQISATSSYESYIVKLDKNGDYSWGFNLKGDNGHLYFWDLTNDPQGNIYIIGDFRKTYDFDPGPGVYNLTADYGNNFILKLSPEGDFLKVVTFDGGYNRAHAIEIDPMGNIYTTGYLRDDTDFDPGPEEFIIKPVGSPQVADPFISKLDKDFNFQWAKSYGSYGYAHGSALTTDHLGNVYFTGVFEGSMDFDPEEGTRNITSSGRADFFVSKLDKDGNQKWVHTFGSNVENDEATSMASDSEGNIYLSGYLSGTVDFDPGENIANLGPVEDNKDFLVKLDTNGNYQWAVNTVGGSIAVSPEDDIYVTGSFQKSFIFDPGNSDGEFFSNGEYDAAVAKYNSGGDYLWALTFGGDKFDSGYTIDANDAGNVVGSGVFSGTIKIYPEAPGITSTGLKSDIYVFKFREDISEEEEEEKDLEKPKIKFAPNPTDGLIEIDLENEIIVSVEVSNVQGKIIYRDENIGQSTYSFTLNGASGIYFMKITFDTSVDVFKLIKR